MRNNLPDDIKPPATHVKPHKSNEPTSEKRLPILFIATFEW